MMEQKGGAVVLETLSNLPVKRKAEEMTCSNQDRDAIVVTVRIVYGFVFRITNLHQNTHVLEYCAAARRQRPR